MQKGLLLVNLGTPDSPSVKDVRRYLREFLMDPHVVSLPWLARALLVYGLILPFRPKQSAHAYQQIWQKDGSPLMHHSVALKNKLSEVLGKNTRVELAMRYGKPSIHQALASLKSCQDITVLPLFPQYATATTGSIIDKINDIRGNDNAKPSLKIIRDFYQDERYIDAQAKLIDKHLAPQDFLLLSFHGLPVKQLTALGCTDAGLETCRDCIKLTRPLCYRAQCVQTAKLLQSELKLTDDKIKVSFQSRLGKTPWIKPYTDETLIQLREQGIKDIAIACPAFVADCLETLEEIGIQAKEQWRSLGGQGFKLIPCLNSDADFVDGIAKLVS